MISSNIAQSFEDAGNELASAAEFRLRDLLHRISGKGVTQKEIGDALQISSGHVGRLMRGQPISIREDALKRLHQLSGLSLKRLIYANALNAFCEEDEPTELGDQASQANNQAPSAADTASDAGPLMDKVGTLTWTERGVISYCRLPAPHLNASHTLSLHDILLRHASWEAPSDHGRMPPLQGLENLVHVRASTPLMELCIGTSWLGQRFIPRGSILEVDLSLVHRPPDGAIVYVQFDNEPADFYAFQSLRNGEHEAEQYTPQNAKYPPRIIPLPYQTGELSTRRRIIGVATRIVEKTLFPMRTPSFRAAG